MSRPLRIQYPGAYYHITCRGNERRRIFLDDKDRELFLERLSLSSNIYNVHILAYILMTNHFHLLLTTPEGNLSDFMHHFNISYTSAFNRRHRRVGHLYQGRYKAYLVDADNYLLEVSRYIHLNPIRIKRVAKKKAKEKWDVLLRYKWSSLSGYLRVGRRVDIVNYVVLLGYMGGDDRKGRRRYGRFIKSGADKEVESPLELGKGTAIVGRDDFVRWAKGKFLTKAAKREQPASKQVKRIFKPQELIAHFTRLTGQIRKEICRRGKNSIERAMLMEFLYRFCHITQPEIGELVGRIDYSAVSQSRRRLQIRLERDKKLRQRFKALNNQLVHLSKKGI